MMLETRHAPTPMRFLNVGHFVDHLFMLIFAKAAFDAGLDFGLAKQHAYAEMIPYGMPAAVLFGAGSPAAAYLAERFSRETMIVVFFLGLGGCALLASQTTTPLGLGFALAGIGLFASIYHPVGLAMVIAGGGSVGRRLGVNGVFGNFGVAAAPLVAGFAIAFASWRWAFAGPGLVAVALGLAYAWVVRPTADGAISRRRPIATSDESLAPGWQRALLAIFLAAIAKGVVFGSVSFVIPRLFDVRLADGSLDPARTGALAAVIFALASFSQIFVGRLLDARPVRPILFWIGAFQPPLLLAMAWSTDAALVVASLITMALVFGQVPISDVVVSRYVADRLRPRILSARLVVNLGVGAMTLPLTSWLLREGGGFATLLQFLAVAALGVTISAMLLPRRGPMPTAAVASAEAS